MSSASLLRKCWIVADMDGTLLSTPGRAGGKYLTLSECPPCKEPLKRWLRLGGNLCVVSTAGRRMWRQIYDDLKVELDVSPSTAGRLSICGFSGAALYLSDPSKNNEMIEDSDYRATAVPGGTSIPPAGQGTIEELCGEIIHTFLKAALADRSLITMLSKKYHAPYTALVDQLESLGEEKFRAEVLNKENMMRHGQFLKETGDALLDSQVVPGEKERIVVQYSVLGIPMAKFESFFTEPILAKLAEQGLYAKKQPNSVVVAKAGVDKATCVNWLVNNSGKYDDFTLAKSIAFGDIPQSVDKPLTIHPPMQFVSVSATLDQDPPGLVSVGSEEFGTSAFITELLNTIESANLEKEKPAKVLEFTADNLNAVAAAAKPKGAALRVEIEGGSKM